jgi:predicted esterase
MTDQTMQGPHQGQSVQTAGVVLEQADAAMILAHGRGAGAQDILDLARFLDHPQYSYLAPQAANNTWYPYSFLAPIEGNEPGLSSALQVLNDLVAKVEAAGIPTERIVLSGFSQGACLASEYVARNARRYGGLLVFSGGVIGPPGTPRDYTGSVDGMPVLIGCSDVDPHIPLERVEETANVFTKLGGDMSLHVYPGMGHTIKQDEIDRALVIVCAVLD